MGTTASCVVQGAGCGVRSMLGTLHSFVELTCPSKAGPGAEVGAANLSPQGVGGRLAGAGTARAEAASGRRACRLRVADGFDSRRACGHRRSRPWVRCDVMQRHTKSFGVGKEIAVQRLVPAFRAFRGTAWHAYDLNKSSMPGRAVRRVWRNSISAHESDLAGQVSDGTCERTFIRDEWALRGTKFSDQTCHGLRIDAYPAPAARRPSPTPRPLSSTWRPRGRRPWRPQTSVALVRLVSLPCVACRRLQSGRRARERWRRHQCQASYLSGALSRRRPLCLKNDIDRAGRRPSSNRTC